MGQTLHNQRIRELRCRHMDTQTHTHRHIADHNTRYLYTEACTWFMHQWRHKQAQKRFLKFHKTFLCLLHW